MLYFLNPIYYPQAGSSEAGPSHSYAARGACALEPAHQEPDLDPDDPGVPSVNVQPPATAQIPPTTEASAAAGTSQQGAVPSTAGRRRRITPPSHNSEVRKLLSEVVDLLKENIQVVKDSEASRAEHRSELVKELKRFNDNYEKFSAKSKSKRKRQHESDSD